MLDTRYFAGLEKNPDVPGAESVLGAAQWRWLTEGLISSRAPFKVIVSGMIWHEWNDPKKKDVWVSYRAERDALFSFIGNNAISGVVLVGGDVHQSGLVKLPTTETAGYPIHSFTVSPLSAKVHTGQQFPEQDRIYLIQQPHVFLLMSSIGPDEDGFPVLEGLFMNAKGERLLEKQVRLNRASPSKRRN
jgi:alkaline phosphatase D